MDLSQWYWIIPLTLLILAALQGIYLLWLMYAPSGSTRPPRQPGTPIMPTSPENMMNTAPPLYGRPAPRVTEGKMVVIGGISGQKEIPLPGSNFSIGRFYNSERGILVAFDEKSISRQHATFSGDDARQEYYITDTNSSYGTALQKNGRFELLTPGKRERIYNEDIVQFGNLVTVRFVLPGETRAESLRT